MLEKRRQKELMTDYTLRFLKISLNGRLWQGNLILRLGKTIFLPSDLKTKAFEKFVLWEIDARKLDNNKGTYQSVMMSKPAYLSVEIVTDNPTQSGKISIPQLVSVAEQNGLSLTCQHACVSTLHAN